MQLVESRHPSLPHYYLGGLGTDPQWQGRGLGSAVLGPVLEICDRDGVPAYLESSKETNIGFYGRHGFEVTDEVSVPDGSVRAMAHVARARRPVLRAGRLPCARRSHRGAAFARGPG